MSDNDETTKIAASLMSYGMPDQCKVGEVDADQVDFGEDSQDLETAILARKKESSESDDGTIRVPIPDEAAIVNSLRADDVTTTSAPLSSDSPTEDVGSMRESMDVPGYIPPGIKVQGGVTAGYQGSHNTSAVTIARERRHPWVIVLAVVAAVFAVALFVVFPGMQSSSAGVSSSSSKASQSEGSSSNTSAADDGAPVLISESEFEDSEVREALESQIDSDGDGALSESEIEGAHSLDLSGTESKSLGGIGILSNLRVLDITGCTLLSEVDLSPFSKLEVFKASGTALDFVDFTDNSELGEVELEDSVEVAGIESTKLRQQWQVVSYSQNGYGGYGSNLDDSWSSTYSYDADGRLASLTKNDVGNGSSTRSFSYDGDGNLASAIECDSSGHVMSELTCTWTGSSVAAVKRNQAGNEIKSYYVQFDGYGRPMHVDLGGSDFSVDYEYESSDGPLTAARYHESGTDYVNRFYYEDGRLVLEDDAVSGAARDIRYSYDDQGRCTGRTITDALQKENYSVAEFTYDAEGLLVCDSVDLSRDKHGNVIKRTFYNGSNEIGTCAIAYKRVFTSSDSPDRFQPLVLDDPSQAPVEVIPCTVNIMSDQDLVTRVNGPYVLRTI